jgi:hypothetical protein
MQLGGAKNLCQQENNGLAPPVTGLFGGFIKNENRQPALQPIAARWAAPAELFVGHTMVIRNNSLKEEKI